MVSADFGQTYDCTAVCVTERVLEPVGETYNAEVYDGNAVRVEVRQPVEQRYNFIRLDRVPLRTPYTKIAEGISTLIRELYEQHKESEGLTDLAKIKVALAIDEGGVGKAVRDILAKELRESIPTNRPRLIFLPVTVHGGAATITGKGWVHTPKKDLISAGLVCFQNERLKIGNLEHRATLEEELRNYRLKQNLSTSNVAFEPLREGQHDDLVFATCMSC